MESHRGIPATSRIKMERIVNRKYIHHIILTVVMMRGNIFSSRPSARYRWYILVPGRVMMLIINTTTPTPPIHWVSDLQNWMVWVSCDGAVIIVSPVPVHHEVDSNTEFKGDMPSIRINGMLPKRGITSHAMDEMAIACVSCISPSILPMNFKTSPAMPARTDVTSIA